MDPVTTITTALIVAATKLSDTVVKDAYEGIKSLIKHKFGDDSRLARAVQDVQETPQSDGFKTVLKEQVVVARADQDAELVQATQKLIELIHEQPGGQKAIQQVSIHIQGDQNVAAGIGNITVNRDQQR